MPAPTPSFAEALRVWWKIGLASFGGPAGQIALMHRVLVEEKRWIGEARFLHALNYCMLLPGPEAQQLATYIGWLLHGTRGGLVAGLLFVLPGFVLMMVIAVLYVGFGELVWLRGLLYGLQAAALAIVAEAVLRVGRRALKHPALWAIAGAAFVAIFAFGVPFPWVIGGAALMGLLGMRRWPEVFRSPAVAAGEEDEPVPVHARPRPGWTLKVLLSGVALWGLPLLALLLFLGVDHVYAEQGLFFSRMAVVTFGGAYAALAYVAQQAVQRYHWLTPTEMVQGLGLAETTPGPLILVLTFVGFLGAHGDPGALPPVLAGLLGGGLSAWMTFVPCFLWIFLGAPYIERLRHARALGAALTGITAAVVGVILNLSLWFAIHVLFADVGQLHAAGLKLPWPVLSSLDPAAALLAAAAMLAMLRLKLGLGWTLAGCSALGWLLKGTGLAG